MTEEEQEQQMLLMSVLKQFAQNLCELDCNCDDH
jgi:hypothetical protein